MKHFIIDTAPPMSNGLMIAALAGPQDVALSATTALKHLMQRDEAVTFAQADPDGLFIYNNSTPSLKREQESGLVTIVWPQLELHHAGPGDEPGPVFLTGWRPQIGMHGLIDDLGEIAEMCGVRNMIHLTSGYGDQPHTRPTIISALATSPHENPELYEITMSLGKEPNARPLEDAVLMQACLVKDMGYLSVCGHVSRYLGMIPDYQVAADLARNIQKFTRSAGKPLLDLEPNGVRVPEDRQGGGGQQPSAGKHRRGSGAGGARKPEGERVGRHQSRGNGLGGRAIPPGGAGERQG